MKKLRGEKDIEATLQRLDRLTLDEVRATAAQTLEFVYRLVRHRRVVMDGENISTSAVFRSMLNIYMQTETDQQLASPMP
jgi:hypothetical protein